MIAYTESFCLEPQVIRVDAYFFYQVGAALRPLSRVSYDTTCTELGMLLYGAEAWLKSLLEQQIIRIKMCVPKGRDLLSTIQILQNWVSGLSQPQSAGPIGWETAFNLSHKLQEFEAVLAAELSLGDIYVLREKSGYDTTALAENGIVIFPTSLAEKVPEAIPDAMEAGRCIAFELPTAAAFHMHRLNEAVLRRYYTIVTGNSPHPQNRNIRAYVDALKKQQKGDKKVWGALSTLNNLHRNPVIHPGDRLESPEEAISLLGSIQAVVGYMLKVIPPESLTLVPSPSDVKDPSEPAA